MGPGRATLIEVTVGDDPQGWSATAALVARAALVPHSSRPTAPATAVPASATDQ